MHFTAPLTAFIALASAAALDSALIKRQDAACAAGKRPTCCQTDVLGLGLIFTNCDPGTYAD
jgi:hypothetical protein